MVVGRWPTHYNIKKPKYRKTGLYLVFLHMALAFLLLETGFTKGSEDFRINHRWKKVKRLMTLQRYIYDQRLPHGSRHKAVTDGKNSEETVVSKHRSTTSDKGQTRWTESIEMLSQIRCKNTDPTWCPLCTSGRSCLIYADPVEPWNKHLISPLFLINSAHCTIMTHKCKSKKKKKTAKAKASSTLWPSVEWPGACWPFSFSTQ